MVLRPNLSARFSPFIIASACPIFFSMCFGAGLISTAPMLRAQDAEIKTDVENSRFQFEGEVNANSTFVHSGPSDIDYSTMRLDRGAHVTVVGIRFDWLKIVPPPGSFCYVAKAFVERRDNGSVGRVTNALNVHVGSDLTDLKVKIAQRLEAGTDVEIIDEKDEYFRIKPPTGVYVYIKKEFVTPLHAVAVKSPDQDGTSTPPAIVQPPINNSQPDVAGTTTTQPSVAGLPSTQPAVALVPSTQPDAASAQADFDKLEGEFATQAAQPLENQKPAELAAGYDKVAKGGLLPDSMRKIAEYKAAMLKVHADDQTQYLAVKKEQDEAKARMASLRAEREELEARVKSTAIKSYAAVGTLRPSSLQQGQSMLYRLTDPATGRTVLYVRSNDPKIGSMVNQFVGVNGNVVDDATLSLKLIEPSNIDPVDQSKLYTSVMSQIVPPSLQPVGQASTGQ